MVFFVRPSRGTGRKASMAISQPDFLAPGDVHQELLLLDRLDPLEGRRVEGVFGVVVEEGDPSHRGRGIVANRATIDQDEGRRRVCPIGPEGFLDAGGHPAALLQGDGPLMGRSGWRVAGTSSTTTLLITSWSLDPGCAVLTSASMQVTTSLFDETMISAPSPRSLTRRSMWSAGVVFCRMNVLPSRTASTYPSKVRTSFTGKGKDGLVRADSRLAWKVGGSGRRDLESRVQHLVPEPVEIRILDELRADEVDLLLGHVEDEGSRGPIVGVREVVGARTPRSWRAGSRRFRRGPVPSRSSAVRYVLPGQLGIPFRTAFGCATLSITMCPCHASAKGRDLEVPAAGCGPAARGGRSTWPRNLFQSNWMLFPQMSALPMLMPAACIMVIIVRRGAVSLAPVGVNVQVRRVPVVGGLGGLIARVAEDPCAGVLQWGGGQEDGRE